MKKPSRNNFDWRPNDNSSQTKIRYQLEAEHWMKAFKGISSQSSGGISELFGIIGIFASILIYLLYFIFYAIQAIFRLIFPKKDFIYVTESRPIPRPWTVEEIKIKRESLLKSFAESPEWVAYQESIK